MPQKIQATNIEMSLLGSQQESGVSTVVYIPNAIRSNWLTCRNISSAAALTLGVGATIGLIAYLTSNTFTETSVDPMSSNDTELFFTNQSSRSLWRLCNYIEETDFTQCAPSFIKHWENYKDCGTSLCHCVRNARDVFEKHCHLYAQNVAPSACQNAANVMQRVYV